MRVEIRHVKIMRQQVKTSRTHIPSMQNNYICYWSYSVSLQSFCVSLHQDTLCSGHGSFFYSLLEIVQCLFVVVLHTFAVLCLTVVILCHFVLCPSCLLIVFYIYLLNASVAWSWCAVVTLLMMLFSLFLVCIFTFFVFVCSHQFPTKIVCTHFSLRL